MTRRAVNGREFARFQIIDRLPLRAMATARILLFMSTTKSELVMTYHIAAVDGGAPRLVRSPFGDASPSNPGQTFWTNASDAMNELFKFEARTGHTTGWFVQATPMRRSSLDPRTRDQFAVHAMVDPNAIEWA
jgi:hypothetical protein